MAYYVYIIQSDVDNSFYKGYSEDPHQRLIQHNNKESRYTALKTPWKLIYIEELQTKKDALIREKALKKYSHPQIEKLIASSKNVLS